MTRFLLVILAICTLSAPAFAAQTVYLKDGGKIRAKSVWRTKDKVHVLINRDTLTDFPPLEINMKKTFARNRKSSQKPGRSTEKSTSVPATIAPSDVTLKQKNVGTKSGLQLPSLPKLTEKNPGSLVPKGEEGAIRKQKREMTERLGE